MGIPTGRPQPVNQNIQSEALSSGPKIWKKRAIFGAPHRTTPAGQSKHAIKGAIVRPENPETSFAQESQKMYLECRVASNPSVLVFGRLNQAPDQATTCSPCEKFAF